MADFAKEAVGLWSRLPPAADAAVSIRAALALCAAPAPNHVRFLQRTGQLFRVEGNGTEEIVLGVRSRKDATLGTVWLAALAEGSGNGRAIQMVFVEQPSEDGQVRLLLVDDHGYAACPKASVDEAGKD